MKAVRKALKLNQTEFAALMGSSTSTISMIEVGQNPLTEQNIKLLCKTFNVNETWLRTGEGEMFSASPYEPEFFDIYRQLQPKTQAAILRLARDLLESQQDPPNS